MPERSDRTAEQDGFQGVPRSLISAPGVFWDCGGLKNATWGTESPKISSNLLNVV